MVFDDPVKLPARVTFVACEAPVVIPDLEEMRGLYVAVLEDRRTPLHLLPLDHMGALPNLHDLETSGCGGQGHQH